MARNFPQGLQTDYRQTPGPVFAGFVYAHDPLRDHYLSGQILQPVEVAQKTDATVTWGVNGEAIGFTFDGVTIPALALTDDDTSALALQTAIDAYILAHPDGALASTSLATNVVTVTFADFVSHVVPTTDFATGTSAVANALNTAALSYARLDYGLGVMADPNATFDQVGPDLLPITAANGASAVLAGVLAYNFAGMTSTFHRDALGFDPLYLPPIQTYQTIAKGSVTVPWIGTLPTTPGGQAFWINDPSIEIQRGSFRSDVGGAVAVAVPSRIEGVVPELNLVKVKFDL